MKATSLHQLALLALLSAVVLLPGAGCKHPETGAYAPKNSVCSAWTAFAASA